MAIANFSFWPKKIKQLPLLFLILASCQVTTKRQAPGEFPPLPPPVGRPSDPMPPIREDLPQPPPAEPMPVGQAPKIGLILGPGALRTYAHVGVVQEFVKQKMPIHAVAGIEMGALVAAIYANKGLPYDVDWQMMKLKESDLVQKGLLSGQVKAGDVKSLREFMSMALSSNKAENSKVSFVCPALHIEKQQVYMMNKGPFVDMLPFCLAYPPLFNPHQQNVASVLSLRTLVDYMRSRGVNYIVYVDVLAPPVRIKGAELETQILWSQAAEALGRKERGVDYIVQVPLTGVDLLDFGRRRELVQKGQQAATEAAAKIMKNW